MGKHTITLNVPDSIKSMCKFILEREGFRAAVSYMESQIERSHATGVDYVIAIQREEGKLDIRRRTE